MPTKEIGYTSLFMSLLSLMGWVFATSWRELALLQQAQAFINSCQQLGLYVWNQFFFVQMGVGFFGLLLLLMLMASIVKAVWLAKSVCRSAQPHHPKLQATLTKLDINPNRVIQVAGSTFQAMSVGWLFPKIVVSEGLVQQLPQPALCAIMLHEWHHVRYRHPLLFLLAGMVSQALWFIPSLKDVTSLMKSQLEVAADQAAIQAQGTDRHLVTALDTYLGATTPKHSQDRAVLPGFAQQSLHKRLTQLNNQPATTSKHRQFQIIQNGLISGFVLVLMIGFVVIHPARAAQPKSQQEPANSTPACSLLGCVTACVQEELMSPSTEKPPLQSKGQIMSQ